MSNPVIKPDLTPATVDAAVTAVVTQTAPFIPAKIRAIIYTTAGLVGVAGVAAAPVFGGTIGDVLGGIGAAATAVTSVLALSHINR